MYNYSKNEWFQAGIITPSARIYHSMVYDSTHKCTILFGGQDIGGYKDDTWVYHNITTNIWTNMNPSTKPSPRIAHSMVYDPRADHTILFGGGGIKRFNETWVYDYNDNSWSNLTTFNRPSARALHIMAYDIKYYRTILFGGEDGSGDNDEIWSYNFFDNSWKNLTISGSKPSERNFHSMVYYIMRFMFSKILNKKYKLFIVVVIVVVYFFSSINEVYCPIIH